MPAYWDPCVGDWLLPRIFEARNFEQLGRPMALVVASEAASACPLVTAAIFLLGLPAAVVMLLGVVAMDTAPATTLMIVREYDTRGPLTEALLALLATNNLRRADPPLYAAFFVLSGAELPIDLQPQIGTAGSRTWRPEASGRRPGRGRPAAGCECRRPSNGTSASACCRRRRSPSG